MSMMAEGPHEVVVDDPDVDGIIYIHCTGCPWNTHATDKTYVPSLVLRHRVITGTVSLK